MSVIVCSFFFLRQFKNRTRLFAIYLFCHGLLDIKFVMIGIIYLSLSILIVGSRKGCELERAVYKKVYIIILIIPTDFPVFHD